MEKKKEEKFENEIAYLKEKSKNLRESLSYHVGRINERFDTLRTNAYEEKMSKHNRNLKIMANLFYFLLGAVLAWVLTVCFTL